MTFDKLCNLVIVVALSVAGTNLYWFIQYRSEIGSARCDFEMVLSNGQLTAVTGADDRPAGLFSGTMDGRILLTPQTGGASDVTACMAGKIKARQLRILSAGGNDQHD